VFDWRPPRRWETVVFVAPDTTGTQSPPILYVKRIVGLPGETIRLHEGDVYADDQICRKSWRQMQHLQQAILDMDYPPQPDGWKQRWLVDPVGTDHRLPRDPNAGAPRPADEHNLQGSILLLNATTSPQQQQVLTYRHWDYDEQLEVPLRAENSYNGAARGRAFLPPLHDFALECHIEVVNSYDNAELAVRLYDGADTVEYLFPIGGPQPRPCRLLALPSGMQKVAPVCPWLVGTRLDLSVAFFDRRAVLAVDNQVVLWMDLPSVHNRKATSQPLQIQVRGAYVRIHHLRLFTDVYYVNDGNCLGAAGVSLGNDEYFLMGDNSANSTDSRHWPHAGIPRSALLGKPFLLCQPLRPYRSTADQSTTVQILDWSRLRWLR
jgi:signal peptidase I